METTAMRSAAASADPAGSGSDSPTQPLGITDPLSLTPAAKASVQVLIVDDERTLRESCASMLKHEGYSVRVCSRGDEALETLKRTRFDIVLLDLYMAQVQGLELLRVALENHAETIVIVMTGHPSVTSNIEVLQAGPGDYRPKPFSATHLQILLGRAAHAVIVARETRDLQAGSGTEGGGTDKVPLIGVSSAFRRATDLARRVASTDASVFITGESGVGKEQIAQFIHNHSRRSSRPLVAINCAALPSGQLREDLYYRLRVVPIQVPPLRERPEDIPLLATHFLAYYWRRHRESDAPLPKLSETAVRELRSRPWKGNVRELQNVVEHMVVLLRPGADIQPEDIPVIDGPMPADDPDESASAIKDADSAIADGYRATRERLLGRFERRFLQQLVTQADGNGSRAARIARVNRTTLYRLMERYGLQRKLLASDLEEPEE